MRMTSKKIKLSFCFCFFLLFISCATPHRGWHLDTVSTDCPQLTYKRLFLDPCNPHKELQAELITIDEKGFFYLNSLRLLIVPSSIYEEENGEMATAEVNVEIDGENSSYQAILFQGSQKLLLPQIASDTITGALLNESQVILTVGKYRTELINDNFSTLYFKEKQRDTLKSGLPDLDNCQ